MFGSNTAGRHGKGAALHALKSCGAEYGKGEGPQGRSYAIPTKDGRLKSLDLGLIHSHVQNFIDYAKSHPEQLFQITPIGCGLAGYKPYQIAPFFRNAPENCWLPDLFVELLKE